MRMRPVRALLVPLLLAVALPVRAEICGDADGSGAVTVTDGVQTLRAAAGLASSCTAARCDVDASNAISVTDGVNVLRAAAGLVVTLTCPGAEPTCTTATAAVSLTVPRPIGAATLTIAYPASGVALPGSGDVDADRVTFATPGAIFGNGQPKDFDDRVVFTMAAADGLGDGALLTVRFDCLGPAPRSSAFTCTLTDVVATDGVSEIAGATCAVAVSAE